MELLTKKNKENEVLKISQSLPGNMICFSHLRWNFVYQRPQHLLTRFSRSFNIIFLEEPLFDSPGAPFYAFNKIQENLLVMVPHLAPGNSAEEDMILQRTMFSNFMEGRNLTDFAFWYYTPMALEFSRKFIPELTIFDCMDELSAFKFAPERLKLLEKELLKKADIVFTGGHSLFQAKKAQHSNIFPFPSSIEKEHFSKARTSTQTPADQPRSKKPVLGFYGVLDERFDIDLIRGIAEARPDWELVLIGPVVKINPDTLPRNKNIHYLGAKTYQELPAYLAGWNIALIPFLLNESTRYISPTKTPEYLAAGIPVISTPIADVVSPYGTNKLVHICCDAPEFISAAEKELKLSDDARKLWLSSVDSFLAGDSWDRTCQQMLKLIVEALPSRSYTPLAMQKYV